MSESWGQFVALEEDNDAILIDYLEEQEPVDLKKIFNANKRLMVKKPSNDYVLSTMKIITLCWICLLVYLTKNI